MKAEDIAARSNAIYDQARSEGLTGHDRTLWKDPAKQYYRFSEILRMAGNIEQSDLNVLDVGCGNGELLKYLNFNGFRGHYRGVDIHNGQVEEARRRFPTADFQSCDILDTEIEPANIVMLSGIFNADCGQTLAFVETFLQRCASLSRNRLIFNAISTHVNFRDTGLWYLSPEDAIGIAARLSHRFELRHGFLPFNYTVCIHMDGGHWQSLPWNMTGP